MADTVSLSAPYVVTYNMLKAYFEGDPTISVSGLDDETRSCSISTPIMIKYLLLSQFLKTSYPEHGEVGLSITVEYTGSGKMTEADLAEIVKDNPRFEMLFVSGSKVFGFSSVIFKNGVIQYSNDNIYDPFKHKTDLMENASKTLFKNHVLCSTATENFLGIYADDDNKV